MSDTMTGPWRIEGADAGAVRILDSAGEPVVTVSPCGQVPAELIGEALCGAVNAAERGSSVGTVLTNLQRRGVAG